jgi:hypothetical protein
MGMERRCLGFGRHPIRPKWEPREVFSSSISSEVLFSNSKQESSLFYKGNVLHCVNLLLDG